MKISDMICDDMYFEWVSLLFRFEDLQAIVRVEFFVHGLEFLDSHGFKATGSTLQNADLELDLTQLLLVLLLLLLLVLLLQHLQLVLLLLQTLLDYLSTSDYSLLHLLHHIGLYLDSNVERSDSIVGVHAAFLKEWFEIVIFVARFLTLLLLVAILLEFFTGLVV